MRTHKKILTLTLTTFVILQSAFPLLQDHFMEAYTPFVSASLLEAPWKPLQQSKVADDNQSSFWTTSLSGEGNMTINLSDDSLVKKTGVNSLRIVSENGSFQYFDIYHRYESSRNLYMFNVFVLWWYGNGTNASFKLHLYTPDIENGLYYNFCDDFSGWRQFVLYFNKNFTSVGKTNLSLLKEIHISLETANTQGTWYLDDVIADVVSAPTPETYLAEYEWSLNRLLDHRDEKSRQVLDGWGASNNCCDYKDLYRFDITLPTFTEAYKITGNKTYLIAAKESFDGAIAHLYKPETRLFAVWWNSTSKTYVDELDVVWGAIALNAMFDFCSVTSNSTYLTYANNFAQALHSYGISHTTNLPHSSISVSSGETITRNTLITMETGRLVGAYIKGYELTSIEDYKTWAKDLAQTFWDKRNTTTNLVPLCVDSNGTVLCDFWKPNLDPIQNVFLYAHKVTKDEFYLSLSINLIEADLTYAWSDQLGRTVHSVWTNGTIRSSSLDLVDGPQIYIVGLLQLFQFTSNRKYLTYAEKMWNTIHNNASANNLYTTYLYEDNRHSQNSNLYTQQMMVQCDAYLFYFTKNQTYFDDLKKTVNSFLLYFKMPYGFCHEIDTTSYETISDSTFDWLDSSSYTLGAAIYACSAYSTQNTTTIEADITYYVPYYPMLKIKESLNYANNNIHINLRGTTSYINVTFTLPRGKVVSTADINGSSIFLYSENTSHLLIWEPGAYSINLTMKNGPPSNITINEFKFTNKTLFTNETLTATIETKHIANVTIKLHIPFNKASQTPFQNDAWDVNCTASSWRDSWETASRILTMWILCNRSATIMILNMPPKQVELYIPEESEIAEDSIKLVWEESNVRDFAKYEILMSDDKANWTSIHKITEKSNNTCKVTGLSPETTYYFVVRTIDTGELTADSQCIEIKTKPSTVYRWLPVIIVGVLSIVLTLILVLRKQKNSCA